MRNFRVGGLVGGDGAGSGRPACRCMGSSASHHVACSSCRSVSLDGRRSTVRDGVGGQKWEMGDGGNGGMGS